MTKLLIKPLKISCFFAVALICLVSGNQPQGVRPAGAQATPTPSSEQLLPSFPPGAVALFMQPVKLDKGAQLPAVYLKSPDSDAAGQEWTLEAQLAEIEVEPPVAPKAGSPVKPEDVAAAVAPVPVSPAVTSEARPNAALAGVAPVVKKQFIGFVVPQLPEGTYVAYYEIPGGAKESMRLSITPQLYAADGLVEGNPGDEVKVRIGIDTIFILGKDDKRPVQRQIDVTLRSDDASIAELASGQSPTVKTDDDGYGTWKVRLKRSGTTTMTATAPQFEQVQVYVVGTQPASEEVTRLAGEVKKAEAVAISEEEEARRKQAELEKLTKELLSVEQALAQAREERGGMQAEKDKKSRDTRFPPTEKDAGWRDESEKSLQTKRAMMTARVANVETQARQERVEVYNALRRLNDLEARLAAITRLPFSPDDLLPGDVLLVQGAGFVSGAIRAFERGQLDVPGIYSHAALYVDDAAGGKKMVVEMLKNGYTLNPLEASMRGAGIVDVYRWPGLSLDVRKQIAANATKYRKKFYAYPQIDVLFKAAGLKLSPVYSAPLWAHAAAVDLISGGRKQMICSELVAWAYHDAGLDPQVARFWPSLSSILTSEERKRDYTTPNTLAESSSSFRPVGRLKGPR